MPDRMTMEVDLGPKLDDYERACSRYVVRQLTPDEIYWFAQEQGALVQRPIGDDGLYRSFVFPGLWLDPIALLKSDTCAGCTPPEHAAFVARLAGTRESS